MTGPTPIPTRYRGYHFRSRLEARWAVVFDALGLTWEYEPEGYQLPSGWYLPDFKVFGFTGPSNDYEWFEVKGQTPSDSERMALSELCQADGTWGTFLGPIPDMPLLTMIYQHEPCVSCRCPEAWIAWMELPFGAPYCSAGCFESSHAHGRPSVPPTPGGGWPQPLVGISRERFDRVITAFQAGRSARFEHGQSGAT